MGQVVILQIAAGKDGVDEREARGGTIAHRDRHRAVQFDDRRRLDTEQDVVEPCDLVPVRGVGADSIGVYRRNRRLNACRDRSAATRATW